MFVTQRRQMVRVTCEPDDVYDHRCTGEGFRQSHTASLCAHLYEAAEFSSREYINRFFLLIKLS